MDITLQQTVFYVVAILMSVFSVMTVTTGSILRSATYLLFVLFGTAAIYFILGYTFLGAVQLMVYAGGIVVLYVFSILLTNSDKSINHKLGRSKIVAALATVIIGAALVLFLIWTNGFALNLIPESSEISLREIGLSLISADKHGYVLPFEITGVLLLACMIGGLLIARKR